MGSGGAQVLLTWSVVTKCAYLIPHLHICSGSRDNNKKVKYPEFCMGYTDETWYVGSDLHKDYPRGLLSPNATYLIPDLHICSNWLITKKNQICNMKQSTYNQFGILQIVTFIFTLLTKQVI